MIDSHCHLAGSEFADDLEAVVSRAREAGVSLALVILAAWMARNRKAMQIGLIATGATVLTFGVVQLVWLIVGLDLITGLTVGQEIRQIYVPAGVSIAVGVLLACLAPVASRSKH